MINLLIDIGNSDIKIGTGFSDNSKVKILKRINYSKKNFERDFRAGAAELTAADFYNAAGISKLDDKNKIFLNRYFKNQFKVTPVFISRNLKLPFKINYPAGLGNDRICNAAAAVTLYKEKNILIIDFGTATTFTMVSDKILTGGIISPGIKTSLDSLTERTSLPDVRLNFPRRLINNNTSDNIKAGVLYQNLFFAERVITELKKTYKKLFVIATGGYSGLISKRTGLINKTDSDLTLKGINIIIS